MSNTGEQAAASAATVSTGAAASGANAAASAADAPAPRGCSADCHVLSSYTHIGFDLDHTLARYRLSAFAPFLFSLLRDFLVARRGFPAWLGRLGYRDNHTHKALVWDSRTGNLLKIGQDKRVLAASHGVTVLPSLEDGADGAEVAAPPRLLSAAEIAAAYPEPLADFDGSRHPRWHAFYTFFEMPGAPLVGALVEATDRGLLSGDALQGRSLPDAPYGHLFPAISAAYEWHLSSPHRGDYFPAFRADPARFLHPRPEVAAWLRRLRAGDKRGQHKKFLFLCTNSKMDYTELLCTFSFGPDWRELFDLAIVDAKKPSWFMGEGQQPAQVTQPVNAGARAAVAAVERAETPLSAALHHSAGSGNGAPSSGGVAVSAALANHVPRPFYFVDPATLAADLSRAPASMADLAVQHSVFVHGNAPQLHALFRSQMAAGTEPRAIYFGDHLHTDCMATRQFTHWAAGAVVEEIEPFHHHAHEHEQMPGTAEQKASNGGKAKHGTFHKLDAVLSRIGGAAASALQSVTASIDAGVHDDDKPAFGSFFHHHSAAGGETAAPSSNGGIEWTYWHRVLASHCDVVVGCLTECIATDDEAESAHTAKGAAVVAAPTDSAAAKPAPRAPRLHSSCIHPPTVVRFQPPPFGSSFGMETPAQRQAQAAARAAAAAALAAAGGYVYCCSDPKHAHGPNHLPLAANTPALPAVATLQYSVHRMPLSFKAELRAVFPELSTWGLEQKGGNGGLPTVLSSSAFGQLPLLAVPTFQPCSRTMLTFEPEVEAEKNRLLESFDSWSRRVCVRLRSAGHWADLVDPCTGYPTLGEHGSGVYSEVDASAVLLAYRMEQVGNCSLVVHPTWGLATYPASLLTTAPMDQLLAVIEEVQKELAVKEKASTPAPAPQASAAVATAADVAASALSTLALAPANETGLQSLARFAQSLRYEHLPADSVNQAVRLLADSLACALAAVGQTEIRALAARYGSSAAAVDAAKTRPLWGTSLRASPAHSALVNSAAVRCLDANDLFYGLKAAPGAPSQNPMSFGHNSDALGGVFALLDPTRHSGRQLLLATVIAYEVQASLSACLDWLDRGLHPLSQVAVAVPAAAAALPQQGGLGEGPDGQSIVAALTQSMALAATTGQCMNAWLKTKQPTHKPAEASAPAVPASSAAVPVAASAAAEGVPSIKFVSTGLTASRGIESVELAALGVTANRDALETLVKFFAGDARQLPAGTTVASLPAFERLHRTPVELSLHRQLVKQFPAQFNLQAVIACALRLHAQGVRPEAVQRLTVWGHRFSCAGVQGGVAAFNPQSQGDADHSTPFTLFAALRDGRFTPATAYAGQGWLQPDARAFLPRVELVVDESLEQRRVSDGVLACRMEARLTDGRTVTAEQPHTAGLPDTPLSDAELLDKMSQLLAPLYGEQMARRLWDACLALKDDTSAAAGGALVRLEQLLCTQPKF